MEDNLLEFNPGGGEENSIPNSTNNEKPKSKTFKNIVTTLGGSLFVYGIVFFGLSWFGVPFVWSIFLGFGLGMMCFAYIDSVEPGNPAYSKPIFLVMLFVLIVSLSIHYLPESSASNHVTEETEKPYSPTIESGILTSVDQIWRTNKSFKKGERIEVRVYGGKVKMINGDLLKPHVYEINLTSDGTLAFQNLTNASSKIEVIY